MRVFIETTIPSYLVALVRPAMWCKSPLSAHRKNLWRTSMKTETALPKPDSQSCLADDVLREVWRIKDELSASYGHDLDRLFAEARQRQRQTGRPSVDLQKQRRTGCDASE